MCQPACNSEKALELTNQENGGAAEVAQLVKKFLVSYAKGKVY
jgi:hypothetical protein